MALGAALVDRARPVRVAPDARRVEGRTVTAEVVGEWFRCRLDLPGAPEQDDSMAGHARAAVHATMLAGSRDLSGVPIALGFDDKLDVSSRELGSARWLVTGEPRPLRKKRRLLGWEVDLVRVEEREMERRA